MTAARDCEVLRSVAAKATEALGRCAPKLHLKRFVLKQPRDTSSVCRKHFPTLGHAQRAHAPDSLKRAAAGNVCAVRELVKVLQQAIRVKKTSRQEMSSRTVSESLKHKGSFSYLLLLAELRARRARLWAAMRSR